MAKKKSEGQQVREAFDGPKVEHDELIDQIQARTAEEHERASDSSESAAQTNKFLEKTGLNSQAFSWLKSILKKLPKKDGQAKAMDVIRSLNAGLPMIEAHVTGQGTGEMNLDGPEETENTGEPKSEPVQAETTSEPTTAPDPELAQDAADFDQAAVGGDDVVTPIDFGGGAVA
jgi:hypothetical protein